MLHSVPSMLVATSKLAWCFTALLRSTVLSQVKGPKEVTLTDTIELLGNGITND